MGKQYREFELAKKFVDTLNLKSTTEWRSYSTSGKKPVDIPTNPNITYKNNGWNGMGDWLGTFTIAPQFKKYKEFKTARKYVHSLRLKGQKKWQEYCKTGTKPENIPSNPNITYKIKGWKGYGDWLGTGNTATFERKFKSFLESKKYIQCLNLKNFTEWKKYCNKGIKPADIPTNPNKVYKNKGWKGWKKFLDNT